MSCGTFVETATLLKVFASEAIDCIGGRLTTVEALLTESAPFFDAISGSLTTVEDLLVASAPFNGLDGSDGSNRSDGSITVLASEAIDCIGGRLTTVEDLLVASAPFNGLDGNLTIFDCGSSPLS
jgi:hypothetical protein